MDSIRYGTNPHQSARIVGDSGHLEVLNGAPSLINLLDATTAWQLVRDADAALGQPAAASFKHVSPAGAAVADTVATAYTRARSADPKSSYGDYVAVSRVVTEELAAQLKSLVSDGIIAPEFEPGALEILSGKKRGKYLVLQVDPHAPIPTVERRDIFGITVEQDTDTAPIDPTSWQIDNGALTPDTTRDAVLGMITARYTQSNTVVFVKDGVTIGVAAGQQSRVDCTELAAHKAETHWSQNYPGSELDGVTMVSDGYLPFADNVEVAYRHGVRTIVEPGGSIRSDEVRQTCQELGITLVRTGIRLFRH